jgi:hypothetical protein
LNRALRNGDVRVAKPRRSVPCACSHLRISLADGVIRI